MAFDLSFSEDFFTGDVPIEAIQPSKRPTNILQALISWEHFDKPGFTKMLNDVLGSQYAQVWGRQPAGETVFYELLDQIRKVNTAANLNPPVEVYIDPQGYYSVKIYDDASPKFANEASDLKNEMKTFLVNKYKNLVEDPEDEAEAAIYWYAYAYHEGQWSPLYSILSTSPYRPGPMQNSVESEGDVATMMYKDLVDKYERGSKMSSSIIERIDKVANSLENKGLIKEAMNLDVVSNTIEKLAKKRLKKNTRPEPVFSDSDPKVKDGKDHFPINTLVRARNALQRVNQYSSAPAWYSGSLSEVKNRVVRAVKRKYPSIEVDESKY
jgi:hypothetical protein